MSRKLLLRCAAGFTLFTFVGHTIGVMTPIRPDQAAVYQTYTLMKQTMVEIPFASPKSIATLMMGANVCLSILLLLVGLFYILLAGETKSKFTERQLILLNISSLAIAVTSFLCFFPLPAICTGLAGLLGFIAMKKPV